MCHADSPTRLWESQIYKWHFGAPQNLTLCLSLLFHWCNRPTPTYVTSLWTILDHTQLDTHNRWVSPVREISPSHRQLPTQQTNICALSGVRIRDPGNRAAADQHLGCHSYMNPGGLYLFRHQTAGWTSKCPWFRHQPHSCMHSRISPTSVPVVVSTDHKVATCCQAHLVTKPVLRGAFKL